MGVAVLHPSDILRNHRQFVSPVTKTRRNSDKPKSNLNPSPNPNRSNRRKRNSPPPSPPNGSTMMGQVRILKRGEDLPPTSTNNPTLPVNQTLPAFGLVPEGFYAGSAFVSSPPPSSVPFPAFFAAKRNCGMSELSRDSVAESVLRRALKLQ